MYDVITLYWPLYVLVCNVLLLYTGHCMYLCVMCYYSILVIVCTCVYDVITLYWPLYVLVCNVLLLYTGPLYVLVCMMLLLYRYWPTIDDVIMH